MSVPERPGLSAAVPIYIRIGLLSFGGPAGQIALMHDEIVRRTGWVDEDAFRRGLNVAMLLPGPEAQQLATWLGWRLHGVFGGLAAGLAFILPGAALMTALAWLAAAKGETALLSALFYGIQPAVLVIVVRALISLGRRSLSGSVDYAVAQTAFLALWLVGLPFPLVIAMAGLAGIVLSRAEADTGQVTSTPSKAYGWMVLATGAALLLVIYVGVRLSLGRDPFDGVATLFTSAAFVSFGGAYALLPYVADRAVETYGWLSAAQMLNGLALAEATPGPLILVNLYAGFYAGWPSGAGGGVIAAALTCIYTFVPSFTLILAAAPYIESVQRIRWFRRALEGVAAAVVGVVLNLTIYLGEAALFPQGLSAPEWPKIALLLAFGALALWRTVPITLLVGLGAAAGLTFWAVGAI